MKKKLPEISKDKLSIEYDEDDFDNSLPNLTNELKDKNHWARVPINKLTHEDDLDSENADADEEILDETEEYEEPDAEDEIELNEIEESHDSELEDECEECAHPHPKSLITRKLSILESSQKSEDLETQEIGNPKKQKPLTKEEEQELCNPQVENYLCRCKTVDQAEDIINYCLKRKEITPEKAEEIRNRIKKEGLHSFGEYKAWGHYERKYRRGSNDLDLTEHNSE